MLGAEDKARQGVRKMRRRHKGSDYTPTGRLVARSGCDAVEAAERMICGTGAVGSASVAEGLALAGRRAAALPQSDPVVPAAAGASIHAGWVAHRVGDGGDAAGMAFTLAAGSAQEAVDHCLVAHRLADQLRQPGLCVLHRALAESLHFVRLPDSETIEALFPDNDRPIVATEPDSKAILDAARQAFEVVSLHTRRRCRAVAMHAMRDVRHALLAVGPRREEAQGLASALRDAGIPCGVVEVALLAPFPSEELGRILAGLETIVLMGPANAVRDLAAGIHALDSIGAARVVSCATDRPGRSPATEVGRAFGLDDAQLEKLEHSTAPRSSGDTLATLGAVPAGSWSDRLLLDAAAMMVGTEEPVLERPREASSRISTLALSWGRREQSSTPPPVDLLFAAHPEFLDRDVLGSVRPAGTIVVHGGTGSPDELWLRLTRAQRDRLIEREIDLRWIDLSAIVAEGETAPDSLRRQLLDAFVAASDGAIPGGVKIAPGEGADLLRRVDLLETEARTQRSEPDFQATMLLPRMLAAEPDAAWSERLRRFRLGDEQVRSAIEPLPGLPLRPALLTCLTRPDALWSDYPAVLSEKGVGSLLRLFETTLEIMNAGDEPAPILGEHVTRLARTAGLLVEQRVDLLPLDELLGPACDLFMHELDLSEAGHAALSEELERFRSRLPDSVQIVGLSDQTLLTLYTTALDAERTPRHADFLSEVTGLVESLQALLRLDSRHAPEASDADALSHTLGDKGNDWVDPAALSDSLPPHRGSVRLGSDRRARVERTLEVLRDYLAEAPSLPRLLLVGPASSRPATTPEGVQVIAHPDGLRAAIGLFDGQASRMAEVFAAVRIARLEAEDRYDAELHDPALAGFNWSVFNYDELCLLPAVAVLENERRLRGRSMAAFSELLRSGRPIHVLASETSPADDGPEPWSTKAARHPGLGYLALAHNETFALQSTLSRPGHLFEGLRRMLRVHEPAVAVVSVPSWRAPVPPALQATALLEGRATPCLRYDAAAGSTWADRFDLAANPQPARAWPVHEYRYLDPDGNEQGIEESFTFAHAAALDPAYRGGFRVIPAEAWADDQVPLADYLAAPESWKRAMPFIWVALDDGTLARAVIARGLVLACLERARAWRTLQELAGENNEYARRAAAAAREQVMAEAQRERERLEAEQAEKLDQARTEAASEAMDNLVRALMDLDSLPATERVPPAAPTPVPAVPIPEAPPQEQVAEEEGEAEEEAISFDEPYTDEPLCTTCNECTGINPQLFKYNANKQAYIADPSAGTFQELVLAAEKCPARCIHPGKPRKDDATATEELIARAAPFN